MKKEKITSLSDFMYYYKWHIVVLAAVTVLLVTFVRDCATKIEDDMSVVGLLSNYAATDAADLISADLTAKGFVPDVNGDGENQMFVNLITIPLNPTSEMDMMGSQRAMLAMATDDAVLYMVDEDLLEMYEEQGAFGDVRARAEELGIPEDMTYIAEDGTVIGISLADNAYLKEKGINTDTLYACFRPILKDDEAARMKTRAANEILEYIVTP